MEDGQLPAVRPETAPDLDAALAESSSTTCPQTTRRPGARPSSSAKCWQTHCGPPAAASHRGPRAHLISLPRARPSRPALDSAAVGTALAAADVRQVWPR